MSKLDLRHADCMDMMNDYDDNHFSLSIVDPPYGIGDIIRHSRGDNQLADNLHFDDNREGKMDWNKTIPGNDYFAELVRVSKNQIIWGGNYYASKLTDSRCWVVWDKKNGDSSFADCELAWTSFDKIAKIFHWRWHGMIQQDMKNKEKRIHPTQKPVDLYKWLLHNYAVPGDKILDTHGGSMSLAIACGDMSHDLTCCELDEDYYNAAVKRVKAYFVQGDMFMDEPKIMTTS